ncbi:MAG TPA: SMC family ATPase [Chloroflexota bacterium]|nr:SMC family ATPase [Chloroflexota bacterium]
MIPISLRLRNFMSYGEHVEPLDFTTFQVACLCGENGHGKSALLDAMTWALWGRSRAKSEDDLVQLGKLDMEVEFEFALGSERYCVLRKRSIKASGKRRIAVPTLELQIADGDGYRPMTGESVTQTQAIIQRLLRMDYETFINSAFIVQGRVDEFTLKSPAERKQVLADLLGLERYAELELRAREEARRCQTERQAIQVEIAAIDAELTKRATYEAQLSAAAQRIGQAEELRRLADAELGRWKEEQRTTRQQAAQLAELRQRREQEQQELATLESHVADQAAEVGRLEELAARAEEVAAKLARVDELRERDDALRQAAGELLKLADERSALERAVAEARADVVAALELARVKLLGLESLARQRGTFAEELVTVERDLARMDGLEKQREAARAELQIVEVETRSRREANERLRAEMRELKERLGMLSQAGATCPVCRGPLTAEARDELVRQTEAEGKAKGDEYRANETALKEMAVRGTRAAATIQGVEGKLAGRVPLEAKAATLRQTIADADAALGQITDARAEVATIEERLERGGFLPAEEERLKAVIRRIAELAYDADEHERVRRELADLRAYEALAAEVAAAAARLPAAREQLCQTRDLLDARRKALGALDERVAELEAEAARAVEVDALVEQASAAVDAAIRESAEAHKALGVAQQQLQHLVALGEQRAERVKDVERAKDEKAIYDELAAAFGKNGIQAMIIEGAIPDIEEEANRLLGQLTDGQLSLTFETQRAAKFGDNVIETLDIRISDSYGLRNYEMYSGGEAFRINFAIRVALSKLLARRAGAELQLLVIDEGFGTQDATGRDRLVEAIGAVSSEFEKILVVTHIQELKDAFPVRIDVVKGPDGSQIAATTVMDG